MKRAIINFDVTLARYSASAAGAVNFVARRNKKHADALISCNRHQG